MDFITDSITVKSRYHENNEDRFVCDDRYVIVADGMGGETCGDIASAIAASSISSYLNENLSNSDSVIDFQKLATTAILIADREIRQYINAHPVAEGMGTTVVLLIRDGTDCHIAWCGDSRCYHYRHGGVLSPLTRDHSYVQQLIDDGKISVEDSFSDPDSNLVTRFVGGGEELCIPEYSSCVFYDDSLFILCSDGLSGYCRDREILKEIESSDRRNLHERLLKLALSKGSDDDITVVTLTAKSFRASKNSLLIGFFKKLFHL